jgi:hypothetical protein
MTPSSFLRVYIVAEKFPAQEPAPDSGALRTLRAGRYGLLGESMQEDALHAEWSGRRFVCPRHPRLRMLEGLLAFHNTYRDIGGDLIVPESNARRAGRELQRLYEKRPAERSHILTSPWHVPLRWFSAFDPQEREIVQMVDHLRLRYRTLLTLSSQRLERALIALKEAGFDGSVTDDVEELAEWLDDFPEDSMVELDYGGVARLFREGDLVLDESASELWASIEALESGDLEEAVERYSEVASRWAPAVAVTYSN